MPVPEVDAASLETLVSAAVAAPSIHNSQPWRFRMDPDSRTVEVRMQLHRSLRLADPVRRAQHLSVGAAVFNLRVAAVHLGWEPEVRLLPDPADPLLMATVRLSGDLRTSRSHALYDAIARRHTSRMPFTGRPVPEPIVAELVEGARSEGGRLYVPDIIGTKQLLTLTAEAEDRSRADAGRAEENLSWLRAPGAGPFGIPVTAVGARDAAGRIPMRDFTAARPAFHLPALRFERHAQVALLWTRCDRREDWLRAGQALERVLLLATMHGVRSSILHQALEWPDLRAELRDPRHPDGHPQLLIRFGYGPEGGATPRVPARDVTAGYVSQAEPGAPARHRSRASGTRS